MPSPDTPPLTRAVLLQIEAEMAVQHYTVSSLARALGEDRNTLRRWIKGERDMPVWLLEAILGELRLDPAVFMTRARDRIER